MMAATNGFAGPKLVFRSSEVKRDTEFYKNYIAGKLTEENFKWPECPFKFITKNHLIGAIQSPNRPDSIADIEMTDGPQSPGSSQSQETTSLSSQLLKDMVKMVKGEKTNVKDEPKSDATAPKVEPQPPVYIIYNVPNGIPNGMPNGMPNIPNISNILGMPPQTPIHSWGGATPAHNPAATPMHSNQSMIESDHEANQKMRAKLIPLESDFNVDHYDPRAQPSIEPKGVLLLNKTVTTARFIETYLRTNRHVTSDSARRVDHSNDLSILKNDLPDAVPNSGDDSGSDLSPTYEPAVPSASVNSGPILPSLSSDESDDSRVVIKKDKSSRPAKRRRRSSSKTDKYRNSEKHTRVRTSTGRENSRSTSRREKRTSTDKQGRSRSSGNRGRSRSIEKHDSKRQRVSPLRINKRNNTVVNKDEAPLEERVFANKENTAPMFAHPPVKFESLTVEDNLENLFSGPIRTSDSSTHLDGVFSNALSAPPTTETDLRDNRNAANDNEAETTGDHSDSANVGDDGQTNQIEYDDEMETLQMSQSPSEMGHENYQDVNMEGEGSESNDESDANELVMELENSTPPSNTFKEHNQVNVSTKSQCVLCTYKRDSTKKLVAHYVNSHSSSEVYISRMSEHCSDSVRNNTFIGVICNDTNTSACPFCNEVLSMPAKKWITHFTEHTGEYEYRCNKCTSLRTSNKHPKCGDAATTIVVEHTMENGMLRAYMCDYCNFMQLDKTRVLSHLSDEHQVDGVGYMCHDFVLLREINSPSTMTNDVAFQAVGGFAKLAQLNEVTNSIVLLSDESQDSAGSASKGKNLAATHIPPQESLDATDNVSENTDAIVNGTESAPEHIAETVADDVQKSDSKSTSALLEAKERYPSEVPIEERMRNATITGTIELLSSDDEEQPTEHNPPIMMSCYSVETSDEEE